MGYWKFNHELEIGENVIFEDMLQGMDMSHHVHHYWQFYTPASLSLTNYFHYVSANHGELFRYIGAMYYTEATLALTTKHQSRAIKTIFDGQVSTAYFDEQLFDWLFFNTIFRDSHHLRSTNFKFKSFTTHSFDEYA
jgi:hypothetical protein